MAFLLKGKIQRGYGLALLLLLVSFFLVFYSTRQMKNMASLISHTSLVLSQLESLKMEIVNAETGVRGYVLTKDEKFLAPYTASTQNIPVIDKNIRALTSDNISQQLRLDTLDRLIQKRLSQFAFGIASFRESGEQITVAMENKSVESRMTADSINQYIHKMKAAEEDLMKNRKSKLSGGFNGIQGLILLALIIAIVAVVYSFFIYRHEHKAKSLANKKTDQYRMELENNIEKLKKSNEELNELKSLEKFASTGHIARTIAHEVRNPLTNISLATEQLQEMGGQNSDFDMLLDMISRNTLRINQLVSDLLNATKFVQLAMQSEDINKLLDETLELARDRLELNHIRLEKNYSPDICNIVVDREKIKLAFLNIIVNAIEAMEKNKGVLQLTTKKDGKKCIIEIRDNGKGMDEETIQKIFDPYFTSKSKGNGLGLTNTQNIILNHKGSIKAFSRPSQGTLFIISLNEEEG